MYLAKFKDKYKESRDENYINNRPCWHEVFFGLAIDMAKRSHDAQTQHGSVLINSDKEIVATGYNGFPRDIEDFVLPNLRPEKYPFMIHSEENAILSCARQGKSTKGLILYVTGHPCPNCLQRIWQSGIKKIYYAPGDKTFMSQDEKRKEQLEVLKSLFLDLELSPLPTSLVKRIAKLKGVDNFYQYESGV